MLPGEDFVDKGLADLIEQRETIESLLVSVRAVHLREAGIRIPTGTFRSREHRLYELLRAEDPLTAHRRYNAFIRRFVSFERAAERVKSPTGPYEPDSTSFSENLGRFSERSLFTTPIFQFLP
jgi:hypothetical protein